MITLFIFILSDLTLLKMLHYFFGFFYILKEKMN